MQNLITLLASIALVVQPVWSEPAKNGTQAVVLRWQFVKDKPFLQKLSIRKYIEHHVDPKPFVLDTTETWQFRWVPKDQDAMGNWKVIQQIERVAYEIRTRTGKIHFDTAAPEQSPAGVGDGFRKLIGAKLTWTIQPDMKVLRIAGRKEILEVIRNDPGSLVLSSWDDDFDKQVAASTFSGLPAGPIEKGQKWKVTRSRFLAPFGSVRIESEYAYRGDLKNVHRIDSDDTIAKSLDDEGFYDVKKIHFDQCTSSISISFDGGKHRIIESLETFMASGNADIEVGRRVTNARFSTQYRVASEIHDEQ